RLDALRPGLDKSLVDARAAAAADQRGRDLAASGDVAGAEAAFRDAVARRPRQAAVRMHHATALVPAGQPRAAEKGATAATERVPDDVAAWKCLAVARLEMLDPERALEPALTAVKLRPDDYDALQTLLGAYTGLERWQDAIDVLDRQRSLRPR